MSEEKNETKFVPKSETEGSDIKFKDNLEGPELCTHWDTGTIKPDNYSFSDEVSQNKEDKSLKITVRSGDSPRKRFSGTEGGDISVDRAVIAEKIENPIPAEAEVSYSFSFYVPNNFQTEDDNRMLIAQWKTNTVTEKQENPVLSFWYREGNLIFQIRDEGQKIKYEHKNLKKGDWHDIKVDYQWGNDYNGHCKASLNGEVIADYEGHMGYEHLPPALHFIMGIHRDQTEYDQTLFFGKFKRDDNKKPG